MNWFQFWAQFSDLMHIFADIRAAVPGIILDMIFAVVGYSIVYALVRMVREVRS